MPSAQRLARKFKHVLARTWDEPLSGCAGFSLVRLCFAFSHSHPLWKPQWCRPKGCTPTSRNFLFRYFVFYRALEIALDEVQTSAMLKLFRVSCLRYTHNLLNSVAIYLGSTVLLYSCSDFSERIRDATNNSLLISFLRVDGALEEKRGSSVILYQLSVHSHLRSIHKLK